MAYVLGFFAADGTLTTSTRGAKYYAIQVCDKDIVYKIRKVMQSNHKIARVKGRNGGRDTYRIQIGSKEVYNDLGALGFVERKTKRLNLPKMPRIVFGDFVRGYFDGDGNVWVGLVHKERKTALLAIQSVFTSGSGDFLKSLQEALQGVGIASRFSCERACFRLSLSIRSSLALYPLMYRRVEKHGLYLNRKKIVFEKYMNRRKLRP